MIRYLLENAFNDKSLIGIRTISLDWGKSIIGFIISLEESFFTINEIDEYGFFIGNTLIEIDDIINIEINDRYQKRLQYVFDNRSSFNHNSRVTIWKEGEKLISYFKFIIENKKISTFYFNEEDYVIGVIIKFDKDYIMIKNIGIEGDEDGMSCYHINKLIGLRYDSIEEQKIKLLYENRNVF